MSKNKFVCAGNRSKKKLRHIHFTMKVGTNLRVGGFNWQFLLQRPKIMYFLTQIGVNCMIVTKRRQAVYCLDRLTSKEV